MEASAERLRRLLVLVPWVMTHAGSTVDEVCERFALTREELAQELDLLSLCGLPPFGPGDLIWARIEDDRVEIEMADYLALPPKLTRFEALELLVMGRAVARLPGMEGAEALGRALDKLAEAVIPGDADAALGLAERVQVELATTGSELVGMLRSAVERRARLRIEYYSHGRDEMTEREVDPLLVVGGQAGNWYLIAHDHRSGEERTFRADRIKQVSETGASFEPPAGFDPARYGGGPVVLRSPGDREVVLDLAPSADWVLEATPHERAEPLADAWTRLVLRTSSLSWVARLLLSLAGAARPVGPPELAEEVRAAARRALALYEGESRRTRAPA